MLEHQQKELDEQVYNVFKCIYKNVLCIFQVHIIVQSTYYLIHSCKTKLQNFMKLITNPAISILYRQCNIGVRIRNTLVYDLIERIPQVVGNIRQQRSEMAVLLGQLMAKQDERRVELEEAAKMIEQQCEDELVSLLNEFISNESKLRKLFCFKYVPFRHLI